MSEKEVFDQFYGSVSWQGSQAYQSAGLSPHEQQMSRMIFPWIYAIRLSDLILLAICALTFLTHSNFANQSAVKCGFVRCRMYR